MEPNRIQFQRNGHSVNVYVDQTHVLYFSAVDGYNPNVRLLKSDIDLKTLSHVLELIHKVCHHEPVELEWKQ